MCSEKILYNVNANTVKPGLEHSYIRFVKELDANLLRKFGVYYAGLQLYQDNIISNRFHVVASYNNIPGVYEEEPFITDYIHNLYEEVWGDTVDRQSVFSFVTSYRVYA